MKRKPIRLAAGLVLSVLLLAVLLLPASAADKTIDIFINGSQIHIPPSFGTAFYDAQGRLQIPMRYIIQSCGYDVLWDGGSRTATVPTQLGDLRIAIGSNRLTTPAGAVTMDTAAMIRDGRTYLPLRFVLEALDFDVSWSKGNASDQIDIRGEIGRTSTRRLMTSSEIAAYASPAVFYIEVADGRGEVFASGSGFFIDPIGIGVTNYHVMDGASYATITTPDGRTCAIGTLLYQDKGRDLVVFQIAGGEGWRSVPYLDLAAPETIHNGDIVYAIGSPYGLQNSITDGLVSNANRRLPGEKYNYIQTSAPISPGNSGGPLINQYGEVVGINTASLSDAQNINLAVPVADLIKVDYTAIGQPAAPSRPQSPAPDAEPQYPVPDEPPAVSTLLPPENLRVVRFTDDAALIQWDEVPGADYYHFYSQEEGEFDFWYEGDDETDGPRRFYYDTDYTVEFSGLEPGVQYNVIVTAARNGVESDDSLILSFIFPAKNNWYDQIGGDRDPGGGLGNDDPKCYAEAPWLPDFGLVCGRETLYDQPSENRRAHIYLYPSETIYDLPAYYEVLADYGFLYDPSTSRFLKESGPEFYDPVYFYNGRLDRYVICDLYAQDGTVNIITG